jgi:hypothetical protein
MKKVSTLSENQHKLLMFRLPSYYYGILTSRLSADHQQNLPCSANLQALIEADFIFKASRL